jgi:hypothetical protein
LSHTPGSNAYTSAAAIPQATDSAARAAWIPSSATLAANDSATSACAQCQLPAAPSKASVAGNSGGYLSYGICACTAGLAADHGENACAITRYEALSSWNVASPGCHVKAMAAAPAASAMAARAVRSRREGVTR